MHLRTQSRFNKTGVLHPAPPGRVFVAVVVLVVSLRPHCETETDAHFRTIKTDRMSAIPAPFPSKDFVRNGRFEPTSIIRPFYLVDKDARM